MNALARHRGGIVAGSRPTFSLVGLSIEVTDNGAFTVLPPAGRVAGDVLALNYLELSAQPHPATPSGWTQRSASPSSGAKLHSRTATADASDNAAIVQNSGEDGAAFMAALRAVGMTVVYGGIDVGSANTLTVPSATAVGPGDELILALAKGTSTPTINTPSGFTLLDTITDSQGVLFTRASAFRRAVSGAGAVGTTAMTFSNMDAGSGAKVLISP